MKLYTEEQVIEMTKAAFTSGLNHNPFIFSEELKNITPIELPSDEEIEKFANEYVKNKWEYAQDENKESFLDGAKCMRDKIQEQ